MIIKWKKQKKKLSSRRLLEEKDIKVHAISSMLIRILSTSAQHWLYTRQIEFRHLGYLMKLRTMFNG